MDETRSVTAAAMEGHGAYNRSSTVQGTGLLPALSLLEQAARAVPLDPPVTLADYGASEGRNSLRPIATALAVVRERIGPEAPVRVVHTDLPGNDFSTLFDTIERAPDSYRAHDANVFPSAVGGSFYRQILPPASVTLGWSSWAVQWLSRVPAPIPDHVAIAFSGDIAAQLAYAVQAAEDWQAFLAARSRELRPGGQVVIVAMARDRTGAFGYGRLLDALVATLDGMVQDDFLTPEEDRAMVIPTVGRSEEEWRGPFEGDRADGLSLERLEVFHGEDGIFERYALDGDADAFGAAWAAFCRASVFPTLAEPLGGGRDDPRRPAFFDRLEAGIAKRLAAAPERTTIPLARLVVAKPGGAT